MADETNEVPGHEESHEQLTALLELENGLTEWEVNFVEDLARRRGDGTEHRFTFAQRDKINQIYRDRIEGKSSR